MSAPGAFPSLSSAKPNKRTKTTETPPSRDRVKPANFADLLGTKERGVSSRPSNNQEEKSWIQNSVAKNNASAQQLKISSQGSKPSSEPVHSSRTRLKVEKPSVSLHELLNVPQNNAPQPSLTEKSKLTPRSFTSSKPNVKPDLMSDKPNVMPVKQSTNITSSPSPAPPIVAPPRIGSSLNDLDFLSPPPKKDIYEQLQEQLKKVSSFGKPLVYIIQNGNITVKVAE